MIPKIRFEYSRTHDEFWRRYLKLYYKVYKNPKTKEILDKYPDEKKLRNFIKDIEKYWVIEKNRILGAVSKVTGLKWKEDVRVYVVGKCLPYSKPLTICPFKTKADFRDILIHELIHRIQSQNREKFLKWWEYVNQKYKGELDKTKGHIFLHAVHKKIYLELFNKNRLRKNIKRSQHAKAYKRAWEIVEEEGHEEIIKKFKEIVKEK